MYSIIGLNTKQTYAKGSKADCFRELDKKFQFEKGTRVILKGGRVYPEPLKVVRI